MDGRKGGLVWIDTSISLNVGEFHRSLSQSFVAECDPSECSRRQVTTPGSICECVGSYDSHRHALPTSRRHVSPTKQQASTPLSPTPF